MGQNYTSFHIIAENTKEILRQVEQYIIDINSKGKDKQRLEKIAEPIYNGSVNDKLNILYYMLDLFGNTFKLILINNNFISIYDESYSLENIETEGISLSNYIDKPIIGTGNLDDNVFSILLFYKGKIITKFTKVEGLDEYEYKKSYLNLDLFKKVTNLSIDKLDSLLREEDIYDIEDGFSELYHIALDLTYDDLASFENKYKKLKETYAYSIFKLLVTS